MLTVTDDGSTQRYINNENGSDRKFYKIIRFLKISKRFVQIQIKKKNYCEKQTTRSHAKFPATILKYPYYTPPFKTDQVITPLGDVTCCISN
jgi:hypothetical protein